MTVKRPRLILLIAIILLIILLLGLVGAFFLLVRPQGSSEQAEAGPTEFSWIRSLYGYGPSIEEQLRAPSSVAIAPGGDVYVTDQIRGRILIFRPDGTFRRLLRTGEGGTGKGQFIRPEAIDIDENGDLYIADGWAKKIIVFSDAGEFVREWPVDVQARGVYTDDGKVYVLDLGKVLVFDRSGKKLQSWGSRGPNPGQIDAYQGIAAKDGIVYIADSFNKRIQAFKESGELLWCVPGGVAGRGGPASRAVTGTSESASKDVPNHRWDLPQDLTFDGEGNLVVADAFQFQLVVVDPKTGKAKGQYGEYGTSDGEFNHPTSVDYDARRHWFAVADTLNNRAQIVELPEAGGFSMASVWRVLSSPFRYLIIPLLLLILAAIAAVIFGRVIARRASVSATAGEL